MLPIANRLSSSFEIRKLLRTGKRYHFPLFTLTVSKNNLDPSRFVFIVPKKLDKRATRRNRTKRLIREAVQTYLPEIRPGYDVAVYAKRILWEEKLADVKDEVIDSMKKAEILRARPSR